MTTTSQLNDSREAVSVIVSSGVVRALEAVVNRDEFVERAIRRELHLPFGNHVGRPRKHSVEDLVDCLGQRALTSGEFSKASR